jgi:hypothetical protein
VPQKERANQREDEQGDGRVQHGDRRSVGYVSLSCP